ncbi:MAG TPA: hypothetical protein VHB79_21485 [Polyangiaceae bacterium]|nr:hypothetical protein [Polyangiaceae bacterium]
MMGCRPWLLAIVGAVFVACAGRSMHSSADSGDEDSSGGSSSAGTTSSGGGTASGGVSQGGKASSGAATGGLASAGDTGTDLCDPANYADALGTSIPVRLVNGTNQTIYLGPRQGGCGVGRLFGVDDAFGTPLEPPRCATTCEQLLDDLVQGCAPILCPVSAVVTLQPGESRLQSWDALWMEKVTLPAACAVSPAQCSQVVLAQPADYVFFAEAGSSQQCLVPQGGCNVCTPDLNGGCVTPGALAAGAALQAEAKVTLDESYFAAAGGRPPLKPVDIVFHD